MSLERKPIGPSSSSETAPPRVLKVASNPAQRLQELLRREAQQARDAAQTIAEPEQPVSPPADATSTPVDVAAALAPPEPLKTLTDAASTAPSFLPLEEAVPVPAAAEPPAPLIVTPAIKREAVMLIVVVNSERSTPVEYPSMDDLPTVTLLEEMHGAFLLSDEWQRRGPTLTRIIRLRRRRR